MILQASVYNTSHGELCGYNISTSMIHGCYNNKFDAVKNILQLECSAIAQAIKNLEMVRPEEEMVGLSSAGGIVQIRPRRLGSFFHRIFRCLVMESKSRTAQLCSLIRIHSRSSAA